MGGVDKTKHRPWGSTGRRYAASSVAPVASGYERSLRSCLAHAKSTAAAKRHLINTPLVREP